MGGVQTERNNIRRKCRKHDRRSRQDRKGEERTEDTLEVVGRTNGEMTCTMVGKTVITDDGFGRSGMNMQRRKKKHWHKDQQEEEGDNISFSHVHGCKDGSKICRKKQNPLNNRKKRKMKKDGRNHGK